MSTKAGLLAGLKKAAQIFNPSDLEPYRADFEEEHPNLSVARLEDGRYANTAVENEFTEWAKNKNWELSLW